jgi:hypothetical protein
VTTIVDAPQRKVFDYMADIEKPAEAPARRAQRVQNGDRLHP